MKDFPDEPQATYQPYQHFMDSYHQAIDVVNRSGTKRTKAMERTATGTKDIFGAGMTFDLSKGFPLTILREIKFRAVIAETLWFLSGSCNVNDLKNLGCGFWDAWADDGGDIGPMYGVQWRRSKQVGPNDTIIEVDQIAWLIEQLKTNPFSRRLLVSSWMAGLLPESEKTPPKENPPAGRMALAPCHDSFQVFVDIPRVAKDEYDIVIPRLSMNVRMRSCDIIVGAPHNIASYALILHLLANQVGMDVGMLKFNYGSLHQYANHEQAANEMVLRMCQIMRDGHANPPNAKLKLKEHMNIDWAAKATPEKVDQILTCLTGYNPFDKIKVPVAV